MGHQSMEVQYWWAVCLTREELPLLSPCKIDLLRRGTVIDILIGSHDVHCTYWFFNVHIGICAHSVQMNPKISAFSLTLSSLIL